MSGRATPSATMTSQRPDSRCRPSRLSVAPFQTILVGDSGVGKTSLLVQFDQGKFIPGSFSATVGIGFTVSTPSLRGPDTLRQGPGRKWVDIHVASCKKVWFNKGRLPRCKQDVGKPGGVTQWPWGGAGPPSHTRLQEVRGGNDVQPQRQRGLCGEARLAGAVTWQLSCEGQPGQPAPHAALLLLPHLFLGRPTG